MMRILESFYHDNTDGFLLGKVAVYVSEANGEEARLVAKCGPRALVNVDGAVRS